MPRVTEIINAILPQWEVEEYYLIRGTATHLACELLDAGRLDWDSVDPEILPRVQAWEKFRRDMPWKIVSSEQRLESKRYGFNGKHDRIFETPAGLCVCDLKNSVSPQVRLQLGFYSLLWEENRKQRVSGAVAVELLESGDYRCTWLDSRELRTAERQALAVLTVYNFAKEHNLLRKS